MYVGGDEIGTAAMNVYGQPPHAQHVYLPSYYQGQMTYTRKLSVLCFCHSFTRVPRGTPAPPRDLRIYVYTSTIRAYTRNREITHNCHSP